MHLLTAFSLKNRALIALVTIVAAVFGVIGAGSLKQELMPSVQFPAIAVVTSYPGAAPEVVNADVSSPIETALRGVPQLESTSATSSTGASMVLAQFTYGVDLAVTEQKVERAISRISSVLPKSTDVQVVSGSIDDFPVIQIAVTPADGQTADEAAALVSRLVTPKLSDIDGVRDAQLSGNSVDRVVIRPDLGALADAGLSTQSLVDTLQQSGVLIAAGTVTEGDSTLAVQAGSTVDSPEAIAALPIPGSGIPVEPDVREVDRNAPPIEIPAVLPVPLTIGHFATVGIEQAPESSISRVDGKPALTIAVTKVSAANTVDVSHAVQAEIDKLSSQLGGAKMTVIFDQAPYIEQSIETLTTEGLLGLLFAVLVILVFLMSVRATLVTAISIPTSVLLTFIGLNFAEYTLNMLTLGALTISIGRVVDDSIVVIENIKRHFGDGTMLQSGAERSRKIIAAVREVAGAITASTVTTVAVFLPMAFVDGMVGELFRPFAFTVTIALAASLLVSLTIVPVLAYWFLHSSKPRRSTVESGGQPASWLQRMARSASGDGPTALQRGYRPIIEWTLARPLATLVIAVVIFGATIAATPLMKTNFMGADEQNSVGLTQTLAPGTSLTAQLAQAERVEQELDGIAEVESVQLTIGSGGSGMGAMFGGGSDGAISYSITTDPSANQPKVQDKIRAAVEGLEDAGDFSISQAGGGPSMSSSIEVNVAAPDQASLATASEAVREALAAESGLKQVESDLGRSRPYLSVTVNRDLAGSVGLTEAAVAGQLAQQMQPQQVGQITRDANVTSVYLVANEAPTDIAGVGALQIQTAVGPQRLDELALIEVADGPVSIHTADGARTVTVAALPAGDDLGAASVAVDKALASVKLPEGATATVGGVVSQQSEAFAQLAIALLAAILIVYVVMVATFRSLLQPLLLLASVPFAATGALLLLIVTGIPLGVASLIGVLMLIGIVVTNAIVLVDLVNQYRERGDELREAVLHGTLQRLRPIVMTALATILALTPMGLGVTGQGGFISQPLAVVVIGGLLSSTVLTLVVLPTLYYAVERRREGGRGGVRRGGGSGGSGGSGEAGGSSDFGFVAGAASAGDLALAGAAGTPVAGAAVTGVPVSAVPKRGGLLGRLRSKAQSAADDASPVGPRRSGAVSVAGTAVGDAGREPVAPVGLPWVSAGSLAGNEALESEGPVAEEDAPLPAEFFVPSTSSRSAGLSGAPTHVDAAAETAMDFPEAADLADPDADSVTYEPAPTEQMNLVLEDLGFIEPEEPGVTAAVETVAPPLLASEAWDADETGDIPPLVLPVRESVGKPDAGARETATSELEPAPVVDPDPDPEEVTESSAEGTPEDAPEDAPEDVPEDVWTVIDPAETAAETPRPRVLPRSPIAETPAPAAPAPPVTGELNWEQLMWEATQENEAGTDADATPNTHPADIADRDDDIGQKPSEER